MLKLIGNSFLNKYLFIILISLSVLNSDENRPKIGLALSGGSAKGFAHAGVLQVIDSLQIPIDYIAPHSTYCTVHITIFCYSYIYIYIYIYYYIRQTDS